MTDKKSQLVKEKVINENRAPLLDAKIKVTNLRKAKRLLSKLISDFMAGKITNQNAKDLAYLISIYVTITKEVEIEERIKALEDKVK